MRRLAVPAAVVAFGWAALVASTGGFTIRTARIHLSSHRIVPPALIALVAAWLWYRATPPARRDALLARAHAWTARRESMLVWSIAIAVAIVGLVFGTFAAAGADAFGYLAQARLWSAATLAVPAALGGWAPWPNHDWALLPLGFRPGLQAGTGVPTYAPGLPILMAAAERISSRYGPFIIVPLSGAVMVIMTARLARRLVDRPVVSLVAALLIAASPILLFQLVQPMSDVPAAAFWTLAFVAMMEGGWTGALGGGLAASIAILIRPNLIPVALPLLALSLLEPTWRLRFRNVLLFAIGVTPGVLLSAWTNHALYGRVTTSGYGSADDLFSTAHILPNVRLYATWLTSTHTFVPLLALATPFAIARQDGRARSAAAIAIATAAIVVACYLPYLEFDHWTYVRFLLPAIALLVACASIVVVLWSRATTAHAYLATAMTAFVVLWCLHNAAKGAAFTLASDFRSRAIDVAREVDRRFPPQAVFISVLQSGSVRYYTGRELTLRYDWIEPNGLDAVVAWLRAQKLVPYFLLEPVEISVFRQRFSASAAGRLGWTPILELPNGVRIYEPPSASSRPASP